MTVIEATRLLNEEQLEAVEADGLGIRLGRCGNGKDVGPRRALRAGGLRARHRRRVDPRHHVHAQGGG